LSNKYKDTNPHKEFNRNIPHMSIDDINKQWKKYSDSLANFSIPLLSNIAGYFDASYLTDIRNYVGALLALPIFISPIVSFTTFFSACVSFSHIVYSMNTAYFRHYTMVEARRRFGTYDGVYLSGVITAKCLLVVYILRSFWQMVKSKVVLETQGNLAPLSMEEVTLNSAQTNCWLPIPIQKIETVAPKTYVANDVLEICKKNIALIVNGSKFVNGFFISQNFVLVPKHFMDECSRSYDQSLKIVSREKYVDGKNVNCHVQHTTFSELAYKHIPNTDLCVYYISDCVPRKDVIAHFPEIRVKRDMPARMVVRDMTGKVSVFSAFLKSGIQDTRPGGCEFEGYGYNLIDGNTFNGMCTGVWVSDTKPTSIVGFHLGGIANTPRGCAGTVTRSEIENAKRWLLERLASAVDCGSDGAVDIQFGSHFKNSVPQYIAEAVAPNHPINFMPETCAITVFGTAGATHKYHSSVVYRQLGLKFLERFGMTVKHGPPNMNKPPKWYHFSKNLTEFASENVGPPLHVLEWATLDYVLPIMKELKRLGFGTLVKIVPLSNKDNINGVPGVRFLDALKTNTAAGFPLKGPTKDYLIGADGERDFENPAVWEEVGRMENEYLNGRRCYPIFQAHLKDEPVKLGKDKVRVFFGNGTPFKLVVRKYWLPVARLLSELSLLSECAIGINCHSLEWQQFIDFVETHGRERCVAGDYKGYDQKEFLNVTQASYAIYMKIAKMIGYSDSDLDIMSSMVPDLTNFTVLYFGALLLMPRGNASGQNMTSYVNSTANSLNSRCAYYQAHGGKRVPPFRTMVNMMTYGDDDIGTVSDKCTWYNAQIKAKFLLDYGIEYTPPNKEGDHVPFYNSREVDFLKRSSVYIPEIGFTLGALSLDSVQKSITCGIPSSFLSNEELFGQVLDGALLEHFAHGKEVYESFRQKVEIFVSENKLERFTRTYLLTFFERSEIWRAKYVLKEPNIGYHDHDTRHDRRLVWETELGYFDSGPDEVNGPVL